MKDIRNILENLDVPEFKTDGHKNLLKKKLLSSFGKSKKSNFLEGGEYIMFLKSNTIFSKFAIGALVLLLTVAVVSGFNPLNTKKANAQDFAKRVLSKVSQLPIDQQARFENEKGILEKALNARNLSVSAGTSGNVRVLRFTDEKGEEESVEVDEDDLPIIGNPSVTPTPSGTEITPSVSVSPSPTDSITPSPTTRTQRGVIRSGEDERESGDRSEVQGVNAQSDSVFQDEGTGSNSTPGSSTQTQNLEEKKD